MEKLWQKNYPQGVPFEIYPDKYPSIMALLGQSFKQFAHRKAFYNLGVNLTYKEIDDYSRDFAAYLQNILKLEKGDRVALMMPNILQYPIALFGILRAGLVAVNVNPLYTPPELIHQLEDAKVKTLVVLSNFAHTVAMVTDKTPLKHIIITQIGDLFPRWKAILIQLVLKYIHKKIPAFNIKNAINFKTALAAGKKTSLQPVAIKNTDLAFLQYTGGTTGISKGAMLTHRNIIANILQAEAWFKQVFIAEQEVILTALPLYHIFSLTANCLCLSKVGGLNVLITNPKDMSTLLKEMKKFKFTVITGVNTLFHALVNQPCFAQLDFSFLRVTLGGGMAVQRAVAENWQKITGKPIIEAYGLTETSPCVAINPPNLQAYNGYVGLPVSSTDVCILDEKQHTLGIDAAGELAVKGPQVMQGYWNNPAESAKVFTKEGWLLTGDIAAINALGFVKILERKKDMILVSGFNVYPNEIEDTLMQMPDILEVAVVGVPDESSGEAVKAYIIRKRPSLTYEEIIKFCRANLVGYKVPKQIEFCSTLPKTNVGKISRKDLRNQVLSHS